MRLLHVLTATAAILAGASLAGRAAAAGSGTVSVNGLVLDSCSLVLGAPGALALSSDGRTLSSQEAGGLGGLATIVATSAAYQLELDAPTGFALAPANSTPDQMTTTFDATGATTVTGRAAHTPLNLNLGTTIAKVNVAATRTSTIFPAGLYRADVVVRCAPR